MIDLIRLTPSAVGMPEAAQAVRMCFGLSGQKLGLGLAVSPSCLAEEVTVTADRIMTVLAKRAR
jgi:hypothetical protein